MENQFSNIVFAFFKEILQYRYIANFALKHCGAYLLCQQMFQEFVT